MSQPEPILPHMPDHIKKRIMDSSDTNSKLILRQCSKSFDIQFAETWIHYEHLDLYWNCDNEYIRIRFKSCDESEKQVTYHDFRNGYLVEYANGNPQKIVKNGNFIDAAVEQFVKAFKKRKVFLKVLKINYQTHYFQENRFKRHRKRLISKLACHLASLKHTIHVKNFAMHIDPNARDISRILPFFEPGLLQTILFRRQEGGSNDGDFDLSSIIGMEQWKKARSFRAEDYRLNLGHEDTKHFEESEYVGKLDLESLKTILKNLHNHSNWTFRWIRCREFDYAAIGRYLSENAQAVHPSVLPEFFLHFEIPNFCFLDIENGLGITISSYKRMKRQIRKKPKSITRKPKAALNDMPEHIKQAIVNDVDTRTKSSLALCTRQFKKLVSQAETIYEKLEFIWFFKHNHIRINLQLDPKKTVYVDYHMTKSGYIRMDFVGEEFHDDIINTAVGKFCQVLMNRKAFVKELKITFDGIWENRGLHKLKKRFFDTLEAFFKSRNHLVTVARVTFEAVSAHSILKILPYLEPWTLECLDFWYPCAARQFLKPITETEQWKKAKKLQWRGNIWLPRKITEHFGHLEYEVMDMNYEEIDYTVKNMLNGWIWRKIWYNGGPRFTDLLDNLMKSTGKAALFKNLISYHFGLGIELKKFKIVIQRGGAECTVLVDKANRMLLFINTGKVGIVGGEEYVGLDSVN